jgi:hypothetical protein
MRILIGLAIAAAVLLGIWNNFAPRSETGISAASLAPSPISIWDAHNHAHLGGLPVQHFEDLSLIFTESGDKPAPAARLVVDTRQRQ